jgi:hypothetical protein
MRFLLHDVDCLQSCDSNKSVYQGQTINFIAQVKIKINDDTHDLISLTGDLVDVHPDYSSDAIADQIQFVWSAVYNNLDISDKLVFDNQSPWIASIDTSEMEGIVDVKLETIPSAGETSYIEVLDDFPFFNARTVDFIRVISTLKQTDFEVWQKALKFVDDYTSDSKSAMGLFNRIAEIENFDSISTMTEHCDEHHHVHTSVGNNEFRRQYIKTRDAFITLSKHCHEIKSQLMFPNDKPQTWDNIIKKIAEQIKSVDPSIECTTLIEVSKKSKLRDSLDIIDDNTDTNLTIKNIGRKIDTSRKDILLSIDKYVPSQEKSIADDTSNTARAEITKADVDNKINDLAKSLLKFLSTTEYNHFFSDLDKKTLTSEKKYEQFQELFQKIQKKK